MRDNRPIRGLFAIFAFFKQKSVGKRSCFRGKNREKNSGFSKKIINFLFF